MISAALGFAFALAESGLGLGAIIPGEVAVSGLATNADGTLGLLTLWIAVALGATSGDHLGLLIGRLGGTRMRGSAIVRRVGVDRWDRAADLIQRHGFWAVLTSRLLPFVRTVMPAVAGAAGLRYRTFVVASVLGALAWSAVWVGAGAGVAASGILDRPWLAALATAAVAATVMAGRSVARHRSRATPPLDTTVPEPIGVTTR